MKKFADDDRRAKLVSAADNLSGFLTSQVAFIQNDDEKIKFIQDVFSIVKYTNPKGMTENTKHEICHILEYDGPGGFSVETTIDALSLYLACQFV
jgi:hypothetical protein